MYEIRNGHAIDPRVSPGGVVIAVVTIIAYYLYAMRLLADTVKRKCNSATLIGKTIIILILQYLRFSVLNVASLFAQFSNIICATSSHACCLANLLLL